jgi:hypothetical protein
VSRVSFYGLAGLTRATDNMHMTGSREVRNLTGYNVYMEVLRRCPEYQVPPRHGRPSREVADAIPEEKEEI